MFSGIKSWLGRRLVAYLSQPVRNYEPFAVSDPATLRAVLRPADVLLVEGNQRFSTAVKYLTQSTWSHAALFVGNALGESHTDRETPTVIEADLAHGVIAVPLSKFERFNTRICRPVALSDAECQSVVRFVIGRLGLAYDLKNVIDLARYLIPTPPVPAHWRRRMLALGSADPTRAICSTLLAQAFQSVGYPILPHVEKTNEVHYETCTYTVGEILHIRHHSLFTPRDFDVSPYFQIVKPTIESGFDYRGLIWGDDAELVEPQ